MPQPKVLILDDDADVMTTHAQWLSRAGFCCYPTQEAGKAIEWATDNRPDPIQFALIDEILWVPSTNESQRWTGSGVIREINTRRSNMKFIFVTIAPQQEGEENFDLYRAKENELRRKRGVIGLIHKYRFKDNQEDAYREIIDLIQYQHRSPFESIADSSRIVQQARAICCLSVPKILAGINQGIDSGTGWLIAPRIILTCGHVVEARGFFDRPIYSQSDVDLQQQVRESLVRFNYLDHDQPTAPHSINQLLHYNRHLDYALLHLSTESSELEPANSLAIDATAFSQDEQHLERSLHRNDLLILQHPQAQGQQRSQGWYVERLADNPDRILYTAESASGTSGAPVINLQTSRVVAMHHGKNLKGYNKLQEAILMSAILRDLRQACPELYETISHAQISFSNQE
jgi:CheY-like chemotaxis protein